MKYYYFWFSKELKLKPYYLLSIFSYQYNCFYSSQIYINIFTGIKFKIGCDKI